MNPVQALRIDLHGCAVNAQRAQQTCGAYACALSERSIERWESFYYRLFDALHEAPTPPAARESAESLLRILEDDLGVQLFEARALEQLRRKLGISNACAEQSLRDVFVVR